MKKGISLIVLVITIIVIIILAGAVILSLAQNNPIGQANEATRAHDAGEVESALSMYLGTIMGQFKDQVKLNVAGDTDITTNTIAVVSQSDAPLYKQDNGDISTTVSEEPIVITSTVLGLAKWPDYPGYTLMVDQYANVEFIADGAGT